MDAPVVAEIREVIASGPTPAMITDLHVWRVGTAKYACIVSLLTPDDITPEAIRRQLSVHEELVHITVEVNNGPVPG
jgi:Co/Zn/Cd efflux system component